MTAYRATFDVPRETVQFTAQLLAGVAPPRDTAGQPGADLLLAGRPGAALVPRPQQPGHAGLRPQHLKGHRLPVPGRGTAVKDNQPGLFAALDALDWQDTPVTHEHTSFTFRARKARNRHGTNFASSLPAISKDALTKISRTVRSWRLHRQTGHSLAGLARATNPVVRGWMQYYGASYRTALHPLLQRINAYLMCWIRKKYKWLRGFKKARTCWEGITTRYPNLFVHWRWTRGFWAPGVIRAG